ncbi:MAG: CatA-like O-acetyltransferase [Synechococcaceae cyanobacterium]|nr:CatA-like O-acetyltransferase [Synechococcaceae cyanobacterium]
MNLDPAEGQAPASIPARYRATVLRAEQIEGWLAWSLDHFSDPSVQQRPHLDLTMPLDITAAWERHQERSLDAESQVSLFAWLLWSFMQVVSRHESFLYRKVDGRWWHIANPPVLVPVAVGGSRRFCGMALEDVAGSSWSTFSERYRRQLADTRAGHTHRPDWHQYNLGFLISNLPAIPFTSLSLHSHASDAPGRCSLYFGQWAWQQQRLSVPLAIRLDHANTDPHVWNELLSDWRQHWLDGSGTGSTPRRLPSGRADPHDGPHPCR